MLETLKSDRIIRFLDSCGTSVRECSIVGQVSGTLIRIATIDKCYVLEVVRPEKNIVHLARCEEMESGYLGRYEVGSPMQRGGSIRFLTRGGMDEITSMVIKIERLDRIIKKTKSGNILKPSPITKEAPNA